MTEPSDERLFEILGLSEDNFERFRSIYISNGCIVVRNRTWGSYGPEYDYGTEFHDHTLFAGCSQMVTDGTFLLYHFRIPDQYWAELKPNKFGTRFNNEEYKFLADYFQRKF